VRWLPLLLLLGCAPERTPGVVVLAIDGFDPVLLRSCIDAGRCPNLAELAGAGSFHELQTSNPPQSPVAWSHFITGAGSDVHGIYDFLHRDPATVLPYLSMAKIEAPSMSVELAGRTIPLAGGGVTNLRKGDPFWAALDSADVAVTVVKVPADYPPKPVGDAKILAGMGTPDLLGTPGLFQWITDDPARPGAPAGGRVVDLTFDGTVGTASLQGPADPLYGGDPLTVPVSLWPDFEHDTALVRIGDQERLLRVGEGSDWIPVAFPLESMPGSVSGMVRVQLRSLKPWRTLHVSPVNIDPTDPAQPISHPESYAPELAGAVGRYYTQGMPEDTKALSAGLLDEAAFLAQSHGVFDERRRMLLHELDRFRGGFLFGYFSSVDLTSHMFFRSLQGGEFAHVIPDLYARFDGLVGDVTRRLDGDTLLVMSDHGFAPYNTQVHLNTWLRDRGYLVLKDGGTSLADADWNLTHAYALGLNQLYVNRMGRERAGAVPADDAGALIEELQRELLRWRAPNDEAVVTLVEAPAEADHPGRMPDLLVGYNRGYRSSDESALGEVTDSWLEPNTGKWSGDHCMDPRHVPGVLLSNRPLAAGGLTDLAPTILGAFGVAADLPGRDLREGP